MQILSGEDQASDGCSISFRICGPCGVCGKYIDGTPDNQAHVTDLGIRCDLHCRIHSKGSVDWIDTPMTIAGKQEDLF
jgi:hypothetical protein